MPINDSLRLMPMVRKLQQHSRVGPAASEAILGLPVTVETENRGAYLFHEGAASRRCMLLLSGFAQRSKLTGAGDRQILAIHMSGDMIDLQNGILGKADHSVQALTTVDIAYIAHDAVLKVAQAHPELAIAFWRDTLVDGSIFREWILNVGHRNARRRISHLFCEIATRQKAAGLCTGLTYHWPLTQEDVGQATGLTNVHVNRTMQSLKAEGLFKTDRHQMTISDWAALSAAGDFDSAYLHYLPRPAGC